MPFLLSECQYSILVTVIVILLIYMLFGQSEGVIDQKKIESSDSLNWPGPITMLDPKWLIIDTHAA